MLTPAVRMSVLQVADLRFGYGGDTLFENVTFTLGSGDRVALIAVTVVLGGCSKMFPFGHDPDLSLIHI